MRVTKFLTYLKSYSIEKMERLMSTPIVNGGLEVWCQVEFAEHLKRILSNYTFSREYPYPYSYKKCDMHFIDHQGVDETYVELKCTNPFHSDLKLIINAFLEDINKINHLYDNVIRKVINEKKVCNVDLLCVLIYYGDINTLYTYINLDEVAIQRLDNLATTCGLYVVVYSKYYSPFYNENMLK